MNKSHWPPDIWDMVFDVFEDSSADVYMDIIMAVPENEQRPIDYLNFGLREEGFEAFDYETNEKLSIEMTERENGQTVYITPSRELKLGDKYRYILKFRIAGGLFRNIGHSLFLNWGWGNWPLKYRLTFKFPENSFVYDSSKNLSTYTIEDKRPILEYIDESEYNTSISVYASFIIEKAGIGLIDVDEVLSHYYVIRKAELNVGEDHHINGRIFLSVKKEREKAKWIDIPANILGLLYDELAIYGDTYVKVEYMLLPVLSDKSLEIYLRLFLPEEISFVNTDSYDLLLEFDVSHLIRTLGKTHQLRLEINPIIDHYYFEILLPENVLVSYTSQNIVKYEIKNGRPFMIFEKNTNDDTCGGIEMLFKDSEETQIRLGYKFIEIDIPPVIDATRITEIPLWVMNTTDKKTDIDVEIELNGFEEKQRHRRFIGLNAGEKRKGSFMITPLGNRKTGYIQFYINVENIETEVTKKFKVEINPKTFVINRCFKIGLDFCPLQIREKQESVFIGMPFRDEYFDIYTYGILPALKELKLEPWKADEKVSNIDIMCKICKGIQESPFAIVNISEWNANVLFELGLIYGIGKIALIIKKTGEEVPVDLSGLEYISYRHSGDLRERILRFFSRFGYYTSGEGIQSEGYS